MGLWPINRLYKMMQLASSRQRRTVTNGYGFTIPRRDRPSCVETFAPPSRGRRRDPRVRAQGNAGCAVHPQSRVRKVVHTGSNPQAHRDTRHSLRNGFNGLWRALPGDRAFLPPSPPRNSLLRDLNASVGASGPHGFAVRNSATRPHAYARLMLLRPPHPIPTFVTMANAPLPEQDAGDKPVIWVKREEGIFFRTGLDRRIATGKSLAAFAARSPHERSDMRELTKRTPDIAELIRATPAGQASNISQITCAICGA